MSKATEGSVRSMAEFIKTKKNLDADIDSEKEKNNQEMGEKCSITCIDDYLSVVSIRICGMVKIIDIRKELDFDPVLIVEEMRVQANKFGFACACLEYKKKETEALRTKLERSRAAKYFELKSGDFEKIYPNVKLTEDALKHALSLDLELQELEDSLLKSEHDCNILTGLKISLSQKKDMMQSINATLNKDL